MPAWKCEELDNFEELAQKAISGPIKYEKCYYSVYGNSDKANKNAMNSTAKAEDMKDFYMVIFDDFPYYDKTAFILCIAFCLVPFVTFTHFCWIPYAANKITLEACYSEKKAKKYEAKLEGKKPKKEKNE